jgi:hypothetical protein
MELFGIVLSIPGGFVLSMIYCFVLRRVISRFDQVNLAFRVGSYIVLALFGLEVVFLSTWGAVRSRGIFGPGFYGVHSLCLFSRYARVSESVGPSASGWINREVVLGSNSLHDVRFLLGPAAVWSF